MTPEEICDLAKGLAHREISFESVDWAAIPVETQATIAALVRYEARRIADRLHAARTSQIRAMALLRSLLTFDQRLELRQNKEFTVIGSAGGRYRLHPRSGTLARVEKHGKRWYARTRYCFHDPGSVMPEADVTIGQMLHLMSDEPGFLAMANATEYLTELWNGAYWKRMRNARREREAAANVDRSAAA